MTLPRRHLASLLAVVLVGGSSACSAGDSPARTDDRSETTSVPEDPLVDIESLLDARARAVLAKDQSALTATVADPTSDEGARLTAQHATLAALPFASFRYAGVQLLPSAAGSPTAGSGGGSAGAAAPALADTMTVEAQVIHSYTGFDVGDRQGSERFEVSMTPEGWRLTGHTAVAGEPVLWAAADVTVTSGSGALLIGTLSADGISRRAADTERGLALARAAWPDEVATASTDGSTGADRGVVVLAPSTAVEYAALTGAPAVTATPAQKPPGSSPPSLSATPAPPASAPPQVAATTDGPEAPDGRSLADRVVLNPDAFARLTEQGRAFVVAHECVHVRMRAVTGGHLPTWLAEGYADWVAYRDSGLADAVIAGPALDAVREGAVPTGFPTAADFDAATSSLAPAYARSWLLVDVLADRLGEAGLRSFLAAVAVGAERGNEPAMEAATDRALTAVGTTRAEILASWTARLQRLAAE